MRGRLRLGWIGAVAIALLLSSFAFPAGARKFQMSGTWLVRKGAAFLPLQFGGVAHTTTQVFHGSQGNWTEAPFWPTGTPMGGMSALAQVIRGVGGVTATGSDPGTLRIPSHRWKQDQNAVIPLSGMNLIQITTMLQIDAPYAAATLMAGAGPGSFTWCPGNPACSVAGLPPGPSNGRVVYVAGANRFGGTMQLGLRNGGIVSVPLNAAQKFWVGHAIV